MLFALVASFMKPRIASHTMLFVDWLLGCVVLLNNIMPCLAHPIRYVSILNMFAVCNPPPRPLPPDRRHQLPTRPPVRGARPLVQGAPRAPRTEGRDEAHDRLRGPQEPQGRGLSCLSRRLFFSLPACLFELDVASLLVTLICRFEL